MSRTRPVKVVRIIDRLNIGGPAKHVVWLTAGLNRPDFSTTLITGTIPAGEGDMSYFAESAGIRPDVIREMSRELSPRDLFVVLKLLFKLLRLKPDIIHTHKAKAGAAGRTAAFIYKWLTPSALLLRPRRCKIIHTFHGHVFHDYYSPLKTRLFVLIERMMARLCTDRIVVLSPQQKEEILDTFHVGRPSQFQIVPLGIDFDEVEDKPGVLREEIGSSSGDLVVGIVGRLCEIKNQSMFIKVASIFSTAKEPERSSKTNRVRFAVIGDGSLRQALEQQASAAGLADQISFTGFRSDAASLYCDLDVVALTSLNEGTPLTLIEAFAAGRPAVATEVGGVRDLMGAFKYQTGGFTVWEHGITVPSQDAQTFARALKYLIDSPELRSEMGACARAFARSRMSKDRLIRDIEALYLDALELQPNQSRIAAAV